MIRIAICDDNEKEQQIIQTMCESFFEDNPEEHEYTFFSSGEEVLEYCKKNQNTRIDLLFLDVEMPGISGIETKDLIVKQPWVWRIVFVSSHKEQVFDSFGLKTLGFVVKPPSQQEIHKWIDVVLEDMEENVLVELKSSDRDKGQVVRMESIAYIKAAGNYTEVYLYPEGKEAEQFVLLVKKIGELESEMAHLPIVRVHKSYMVNLANIKDLKKEVVLQNRKEKIPIGRMYKEEIKKQYIEYGREKVRRRI